MGATEANIEIALYGMKSSIFGCAFLTTEDIFGAHFATHCGIGGIQSGNLCPGQTACELAEKYKRRYFINAVFFMAMISFWLRILGWKKRRLVK